MRRLISYITLCSAMVLGTGIAMTPTVINMNTDASYKDGKTLTFRLSHVNTNSVTEEYDPALSPAIEEGNTDIIDFVKSEFVSRLDNWGLSTYSIATLGNDTIQVTLRTGAKGDDSNTSGMSEYDYVRDYLTFSGEDFELDASVTTGDNYAYYPSLKNTLDYNESWIEYIEQQGTSSFPVVVVPFKSNSDYSLDEIYSDFKSLISYCNANTKEAEDENSQGSTCSLVIWANRKESDKFDSQNPNSSSRIFAAEATGSDNAIFYKKTDEDKETPYLQIIPRSSALENGSYNPENAKAAYSAAKYLNNCLHACKYYDDNNERIMVNYLYEEDAPASVENLIANRLDESLAFKSTMIASLITLALVAIVLVVFEKLFALQIFSISALTVYATLAAFVGFGAQFNIAALFALLVVGLLTIAQGITYANKVKDELYKGRTVKKAHQEAIKKSTLFSVDSSVVSIILGVFIFFLAGDVLAKAGTVLVFGGVFALVFSNLFNRICGWMITTDAEAQAKFVKWFGVLKDKIPNPLKEEKQTYFGPYEEKNFNKGNKISLIASGVLLLACITTMIIFGTSNKYNLFNDAQYTEPYTVMLVEVKSTKDNENDSKITNIADFIEYKFEEDNEVVDTTADTILNKIEFDNGTKLSEVSNIEVTEAENPKLFYDDQNNYEVSAYYYFTITLDKVYTCDFTCGTETGSLENMLKEAIKAYGLSDTDFQSYVKTYTPETGVPNTGKAFLGIGIGIAVCAVYLVIRFGFGKGLTASIFAAAGSYLSTAFFTLTRISTTPVVIVGSVATALILLMLAVALFNKTNELVKDSREKEKDTLEFKQQMLVKGTSRVAQDIISISLVAAYALVAYFAFGPAAYGTVYLNAILGLAIAIMLVLVSMAPVANWLTSLFSKIKIKLPERKKKVLGTLSSNKNSSEPEEAIFIGIND